MCENIRKCKTFLEQWSIKPSSLPSICLNISSVIFQKDKHPRLSYNALGLFFPQYRWLWGGLGPKSPDHKKNAGGQAEGLSHCPRLMWVGSIFPRSADNVICNSEKMWQTLPGQFSQHWLKRRGWGRGVDEEGGSHCFSFTKWRVLEMDDGDGGDSTTLWMYLIPPNCILKNG